MTTDSGGTVATRDMERIFSGLSGITRPAEPPARRERPRAARPGMGRALGIALTAAILLIGLAIMLSRVPSSGPETPSPAQSAPRFAPPPAMAPSEAPPPVPADRPAPAKKAEARAARAGTPKPAAKVARKPPPAIRKAKPVASAAVAPAIGPTSCQSAADRDACFYRHVLEADRNLRRAYDRAATDRVATSELVKTRRKWKTALSRSAKEPLASIRTLDALAADLAGRAGAAPSRAE